MNAPCKDCPDRSQGCHARCEKYAAFHADNERRKAANRADIDAQAAVIEGGLRRMNDYKKGRMKFGCHPQTIK